MGKYCPVRKCECENVTFGDYSGEKMCSSMPGFYLEDVANCPFPERHVPVDDIAAEIAEIPDGEEIKKMCKKPRIINGLYIVDETPVEKPPDDIWIMEYSGGFHDLPGITICTNQRTGERQKFDGTNWEKIDPVQTDYQTGRFDMKREIEEKVDKIDCHHCSAWAFKHKIMGIIEGVK